MCGRYGFADPSRIRDRYEIVNWQEFRDLEPKYAAAPSQWLPVIIQNKDGKNELKLMKWGLVPEWSGGTDIAKFTFNARAETVTKKPTYQKPLKFKRCLIPATHFFEWKDTTEGKVPYCFKLKSDEMFSFAGLYDINDKAEEQQLISFTIITTAPNELVAPVHPRMPVIFKKTTENIWLDPTITDPEKLVGYLVTFPAALMDGYAVSRELNYSKIDNPNFIKPILP